MNRYFVHMKDKGFEFQTEQKQGTEKFWNELIHDDYFRIGDGIYRPLDKTEIKAISFIGTI